MDSKAYKSKNLKFVFTLIFLLIFSVIILLYLISLRDFLPFNDLGEYNWTNILTVSTLSFLFIFSISCLISYFLLRVVLRKEDCRELKIVCIKWALFFTLGVFFVLLLNFFHILNIYWGLGILLVVITASFVI